MKIKSYHILFRLLSYMSDKTNGAPLLVKYKLLLGTLIISVASSSASTLSKTKMMNDTIPLEPQVGQITCYEVAIVPYNQNNSSKKIEVKGRVKDKSGEFVIGASIRIKRDETSGTITDIDGNFSLQARMEDVLIVSFLGYETQEIPVSEILKGNKQVVMMEDDFIMCYDPVVVKYHYNDDIYAPARAKQTRITQLPYAEIQIPPVAPIGDLNEFQDWMNRNVKYNERMLKDKIQGDVILSFAIDKQGKITNKKVIGKLSPEADTEALRVLSSSGHWTPGEHNGKKIKTTITMTVNFKIPE